MATRDDQAALLALLNVKGVDWSWIARECVTPADVERLASGDARESSAAATSGVAALRAQAAMPAGERHRLRADALAIIDRAESAGARLATVLDDDYPPILRTIFDLPPMLFYRGTLRDEDTRAVAVVGTRQPSEEGVRRANKMARLLAARGIAVVSGLAAGIDTAAHEGALSSGGRTIAVIGTGILQPTYPRANAALADAIVERGAIVSQFWPTQPPTRYTFPRRNAVMSGLAQGSVVIEASSTSGAKLQARLALRHGRRVFLLRSLVDTHEWARRYATLPGAEVVDDVDDVEQALIDPTSVRQLSEQRRQLELAF